MLLGSSQVHTSPVNVWAVGAGGAVAHPASRRRAIPTPFKALMGHLLCKWVTAQTLAAEKYTNAMPGRWPTDFPAPGAPTRELDYREVGGRADSAGRRPPGALTDSGLL